MSDATLDVQHTDEYDNGLLCSWGGKSVQDMTREELITFIGMLDNHLTLLQTGRGPRRALLN